MSRFLLPLVAVLAAGPTVAQNAPAPKAAAPAAAQSPAGQNVAMVNDKPITKATVDQFVQQLGQPDTPELRDRIKEQLIEREVFMQEAVKRGLPDRPDVKFQLDFVRKTAIIQSLFRDEAKKHPVTDQQVQAEYDKQK